MLGYSQIPTKSLAALCRRLALSTNAGIDARQVWVREASSAHGESRRHLATISDHVARGDSLSDALAATGRYYPELFRELVQDDDGTLGMKFPPEMIPASGDALDLPFTALTEGVSNDACSIRIRAEDGFSVGMLDQVPPDVRITLRVRPTPEAERFGLCFRGDKTIGHRSDSFVYQ